MSSTAATEADVCAAAETQLYLSRPDSAAFPAGFVPCLDAASGSLADACELAASPCRYSQSQADAGGATAAFVVCVPYNASSRCDRDYMVDCSSSSVIPSNSSGSSNATEAEAAAVVATTFAPDAGASGWSPDSSASTSSAAAAAAMDTPTLVAVVAGCLVALGCVLSAVYAVRRHRRSRSHKPGSDGGVFGGVSSTVADDDDSPQPPELSTIVMPLRPTLLEADDDLPQPATSSSVYVIDESPAPRLPSQPGSFMGGGASLNTSRSVFLASAINQGAVFVPGRVSSLFGSRPSSAQPIHSRATATTVSITSPPGSFARGSAAIPRRSDSPNQDANEQSGRGRLQSDTTWSIGDATDSVRSAGGFRRLAPSLSGRLSVALESLPSTGMSFGPMSTSDDPESVFDTGGTTFSTDSDFYDETIRDQSILIDDKEIEF